MASAELHHLLGLLRSLPRKENPSVQSMRRGFESLTSMLPPPEGVTVEPITVAERPCERVTPAHSLRDPALEGGSGNTLLYLHGGAFVFGSPKTHRTLVARLAQASSAAVITPDYKLAPEHPFPEGIDDIVQVYLGLLEQGISPHRLSIGGDSAGGCLTVAVLITLRDHGLPLPASAFCLSPWADLTISGASAESRKDLDPWIQKADMERLAGIYLGGKPASDPRASPIFADLTRLPPMLIHVGTSEVLLDDAARLAERAKQHGVDVTYEPWAEMVHVWHMFPMLPEAHEAVAGIGRFLKAHWPS